MLESLISTGANLVSGFLNRSAAKDAAAQQQAQFNANMQMQKDFAQQGVRWKVADAKAAGIHPLYALGAQTISPSPISVGGGSADTSLGDMAKNMGQDLSRAVHATRTQEERDDAYATTVKAMNVQRMGLENDLLAAQTAKIRAGSNPPAPAFDPHNIPTDKVEGRPPLAIGGSEWKTYPGATNAEDFEKRYGDIGEEIAGVGNFIQDAFHNLTQSQKWQMLMSLRQRMSPNNARLMRDYRDEMSSRMKRSRMGPN